MNRRAFFGLLAAPAIIRVADLMPVRSVIWTPELPYQPISYIQREMLRYAQPSMVLSQFGDASFYVGTLHTKGDTIKIRRPPIFTEV